MSTSWSGVHTAAGEAMPFCEIPDSQLMHHNTAAWVLSAFLVGILGCSSDPSSDRDALDVGTDASPPGDISDSRTDTRPDIHEPGDATSDQLVTCDDGSTEFAEVTRSGDVSSWRACDRAWLIAGDMRLEASSNPAQITVLQESTGQVLLGNARPAVYMALPSGNPAPVAYPGAMGKPSGPEVKPDKSPLGQGFTLVWTLNPKTDLAMTWQVSLWGDSRITARLAFDEGTGADTRVLRLAPLVALSSWGGGLTVGQNPSNHVVLENGSDIYLDFVARVLPVNSGDSLQFPPGNASNWNIAVADSESGRSVVAGFLEFHRGVGMVAIDDGPRKSCSSIGEYPCFERFEGFVVYDPAHSVSDADGGWLTSETFYVDLLPATPQEGLEDYAEAFASWNSKKVKLPVSGWNSWGGGGGSGGLGQGISRDIVISNLQAMVRDFQPYGMGTFLIDDGWQVDTGDWQPNEKFPPLDGDNGMASVARLISEHNLIPGIWIAPFWVKRTSQLAKDHPEWLADINGYGGIMLKENDATLDLSRPEVVDWIAETFDRVVNEWGFKFLKLDFTYFALFATNLYDSRVSAAEAYHDALLKIREVAGPDTYIVGISATGLFFDMADGGRTTLDNMPWWGDGEKQGIKQTVLTASHRYYLNRLWNNHPDLIFFRPDYGLSLTEAHTFADFVVMQGGIVKLGETYLDMAENPDWLDIVRPMIPLSGQGARPVDLFTRVWPEVWVMPMQRGKQPLTLVGLFNWGLNQSLPDRTELAEQTRVLSVAAKELGLETQASQTWLVTDARTLGCHWLSAGSPDSVLEESVEPRASRMLTVESASELPTVVATSRHVLSAGILDQSVDQTGDVVVLSATFDSPVDRNLRVLVQAPAQVPQSDPTTNGGSLAAITTDPNCPGTYVVELVPESSQMKLQWSFAAGL